MEDYPLGNISASDFDAMNEDALGVDVDRQIWFENEEDDFVGVDDASLFYADFPPLPDFPCMSSSSSSSSTQVPTTVVMSCSSAASTASSASSAASWAVLKSDAEQDHPLGPPQGSLSSTASMEITQTSTDHHSQQKLDEVDCMDIMDLLGSYELFEPSSILQSGNPLDDQFPNLHPLQYNEHEQDQQEQMMMMMMMNHPHQQQSSENNIDRHEEDDMGKVFLEWLKSNRETVSADDLRSVKLKKSTIECAARRLGGGKEAMKQLLKLVLEWVQTNHLQKRKNTEETQQLVIKVPPPPYMPWPDPYAVMAPPPQFPPPMMGGYISGDSYSNGTVQNFNGALPHSIPPYPHHMLEPAHSWPPSQFPLIPRYTHHESPLAPAYPSYGSHYPYPYYPGLSDNRMVMRLGPSETKEARKKRMARQRQHQPHSRHPQHPCHSHQNNPQSPIDNRAKISTDGGSHGNTGNWMCWPSVAAGGVSSPSPMGQTRGTSDKRQPWKPEKNLKFLLQKVLKQSDVGNLGRIVLPKKEAETHLPELEARDGISIEMEDIGTSSVWNMRYRYWPNNKSRMYLLENTGEFVRANGLQEGDFVVIYSDVKCGKYMIRGVKVRQSTKSENKRPGKLQRNQHVNAADKNTAGNGSTP